MFRKDLIGLLLNQPASLHELALRLDEHPRALEDDLHHLVKSLRHMPYHVRITPAACRQCGFVFSKDKLHKPGKCPNCHGSWITEPLISIEESR